MRRPRAGDDCLGLELGSTGVERKVPTGGLKRCMSCHGTSGIFRNEIVYENLWGLLSLLTPLDLDIRGVQRGEGVFIWATDAGRKTTNPTPEEPRALAAPPPAVERSRSPLS
jgi:hypothetical protein